MAYLPLYCKAIYEGSGLSYVKIHPGRNEPKFFIEALR